MLNETFLVAASFIALFIVCAALALFIINYLSSLCADKMIESQQCSSMRTKRHKRSS